MEHPRPWGWMASYGRVWWWMGGMQCKYLPTARVNVGGVTNQSRRPYVLWRTRMMHEVVLSMLHCTIPAVAPLLLWALHLGVGDPPAAARLGITVVLQNVAMELLRTTWSRTVAGPA
jgi:hypothetical protein